MEYTVMIVNANESRDQEKEVKRTVTQEPLKIIEGSDDSCIVVLLRNRFLSGQNVRASMILQRLEAALSEIARLDVDAELFHQELLNSY